MSTAKSLPEFFVGKTEANHLICNFMKNKYPALNAQMPDGREDTRSIWYSFRHIEELYKEMIYLNADGLRIYLGAYGKHNVEPGDLYDTSHHLCLVMLPTFMNTETGKHEDLVQEDSDQFLKRPGSEMFVGGIGNNTELTEPGSRGYNQGKPCPPLCDDQEILFPLP